MSPSVLSDQPHSLVLVDACFQQKHNKQLMDPPRDLYCSLFLDETLVDCMEKYVNSVRPHPGKERKGKQEIPMTRKMMDMSMMACTSLAQCSTAAMIHFLLLTSLGRRLVLSFLMLLA